MPDINDVHPLLISLENPQLCFDGEPYQSEACQDSRMEAARIGSEFSTEKEVSAPCKPLKAIPR